MKRFRTGLLALCLLLLCSCGVSSLPTESLRPTDAGQHDIHEPTKPIQSESVAPVETDSLDISSGPMFEFTRATFVEIFDDAFQELSYTHNAFANEPSVTESLGCFVYTYNVDSCTECVIYAHPETDNVIRISIMGLSDKMTEEDKDTFLAYATFITDVFATDDELDELHETLAIETTPFTQNTINFFHGSEAKFAYTITGGILWVHIDPVD